jgi:hypothetical protein
MKYQPIVSKVVYYNNKKRQYDYTINPHTKRLIQVNGKTHKDLVNDTYLKNFVVSDSESEQDFEIIIEPVKRLIKKRKRCLDSDSE